MRLNAGDENSAKDIFQSTHPKRDETYMDMPGTWLVTDFNPLIPNGMRRLFRYRVNDVILFQSTHPKRDETTCCLGCLIPCIYFNPLIPNGMRRVHGLYRGKVRHFNPLIPNGMRLASARVASFFVAFQSTHPKRDETQPDAIEKTWTTEFQSTHPKRDETIEFGHLKTAFYISIHSSQTG